MTFSAVAVNTKTRKESTVILQSVGCIPRPSLAHLTKGSPLTIAAVPEIVLNP